MNSEKIAMRVSINSIIVNVLLSVFKFICGLAAGSAAMVSDAVHSASDVFSTFIVIAGVKISGKESDSNHQYGHERFECVASIILSAVLFATGAAIGLKGIENIALKNTSLAFPKSIALVAAVVSIVVKEGMYWYTKLAAKKINSPALMADAWHHRSDALSSIGSFVGIFGARMGYPIMDPLASVIICVFILKAAIDIFIDSIKKLTDESCDNEVVEKMIETAKTVPGVINVDEIKTRIFGSKIYVDIEISADGSQSLRDAHKIAENVHDKIEGGFAGVKHCMVHVNPAEEKE